MKKFISYIIVLLSWTSAFCVQAQDLSVFADLLNWSTSEQTSSTWASVLTKPSNSTLDFDAANVNFKRNSGFRGGFIYKTQHSVTDINFYWTYLPTKAHNKFALAEQIVTPEFFSGFLSSNLFFGADLDWKLVMNMVDFKIGRDLNISDTLSIHPSIGIKGGTIRQKINASWYADIYTSTEQVQHNFSGLGPTFGIDTKWNVYKEFKLIANVAAAFMWGKWQISDVYVRPAVTGLVTATTITTTLNKATLGTIMFDYFIGLEWSRRGKFNLSLRFGYETQFWANQLRMPTFQQLPVHGDLTFKGATCHILIGL